METCYCHKARLRTQFDISVPHLYDSFTPYVMLDMAHEKTLVETWILPRPMLTIIYLVCMFI